jgi:homocitrate synthase
LKALADVKTQASEDVDVLLRVYHSHITAGTLSIGEHSTLDELLEEHKGSKNGSMKHSPSPDTDVQNKRAKAETA